MPLKIRLLLCWFILHTSSAFADLANPTDDVLVEVSGNITFTNQDGMAIIDREAVSNLPQRVITTTNHITDVPVTYKGPLFTDLLSQLGARGSQVTVYAWDDYSADISTADLKKYQVILATHENDKELTLDDRGPLFVVFPFSKHPEIKNDLYYNKSVWQVRAIEVK
jgi:hypothetical protein